MMKIIAAIPARFASTRFPGKALALIGGRPMIRRVYEQVRRVKAFREVIVATDDERIASVIAASGGRAVMTPPGLKTGTDRIAWALRGRDFDWVMNVQGDEPLIEPSVLRRLIRRARTLSGSAIITAASLIRGREEYRDPNKVKVVFDRKGRALYFSRAPIPDVSRHGSAWRGRIYGHAGVYLFHREAFLRFTRSPQSPLEKAEKLEQLRALELDIPVYVEPVDYRAINVDAPPDILKAERCLRKRK